MCDRKAQYTFKKSAFSTLYVQRSVVFFSGCYIVLSLGKFNCLLQYETIYG